MHHITIEKNNKCKLKFKYIQLNGKDINIPNKGILKMNLKSDLILFTKNLRIKESLKKALS